MILYPPILFRYPDFTRIEFAPEVERTRCGPIVSALRTKCVEISDTNQIRRLLAQLVEMDGYMNRLRETALEALSFIRLTAHCHHLHPVAVEADKYMGKIDEVLKGAPHLFDWWEKWKRMEGGENA